MKNREVRIEYFFGDVLLVVNLWSPDGVLYKNALLHGSVVNYTSES